MTPKIPGNLLMDLAVLNEVGGHPNHSPQT